ncbi:MAG: LamG-like jellyroll fold domain-containing protein [Patescibacteria group bacterium]
MFAHRATIGAANYRGRFFVNRSVYGDGSTGYFSKTFSGAGNQKKFTVSLWVKLAKPGTLQRLFEAYAAASNFFYLILNADNTLELAHYSAAYDFRYITTQLERDPSGWAHILVAVDTDAASGSRVKIYWNGSQITAFSTESEPSLSFTTDWAAASEHGLLGRPPSVAGDYFYGYAAEIVHVNAQQLTPSSFGFADAVTGSWHPKAYTGTYGTNGFHLDFANSPALGIDVSGNGNNWTVNGTVTQTTDSPTDKAASNIGNYCVWNRLTPASITSSSGTRDNLLGGCLSKAAVGSGGVFGTISFDSGKFFW